MLNSKRPLIWTGFFLSALALLIFTPAATSTASAERNRDEPDARKLWTELKDAEYEHWAPWPGQGSGFYPGTSPHGAKLKLYINRKNFDNLEDPPSGSVIIKENFSADKKLAAITIMKRIRGYDPDHHDWYYVKYTPDGKVARDRGKKIAGKVQSCIACHANAGGGDYVFTNDE